MKILNVGHNYFVAGGSDRVFMETQKLLQYYGHEVVPFCAKSDKNVPSNFSNYFPSSIDTGNFFQLNSLSYFYNFDAYAKLNSLLDTHDVDIAHFHIYYGKLTTSILKVLKFRKIPIIQTLHEYKLVCPVYTMQRNGSICDECVQSSRLKCITNKCKDNSLIKSIILTLESYVSRVFGDISKIDLFLSVSNFHRNIMISAGVPEDKIKVLHNFVNVDNYIPNYKYDEYFLYFGRIEELKGVRTLVEAFKINKKKLIIVGEGAFACDLIKLINGFENIVYAGFKSGDELDGIIANSKCVLVPSEWYENCPMNVLEAKALGKAVIASNIGGIPELIRDGVDGYLFSPGDISDLVSKVDEIESKFLDFGRKARLDVEERFSQDTHYKKLMNIYNDVIANVEK